MKKRIIPYILLVCLALLCPARSSALSYTAPSPAFKMQSVAPMHTITSAPGKVNVPYSSRPEYMEALSGDLNPFNAGAPTRPAARRDGRPGKTDGDSNTNPNIEVPLPDGTWILLVLALSCMLYKFLRERKRKA